MLVLILVLTILGCTLAAFALAVRKACTHFLGHLGEHCAGGFSLEQGREEN